MLSRLDRVLAEDPALGRRVMLVTLSFDPARDTPERLTAVRAMHKPRSDWRFVTTRGARALEPILADFGQQVAKLTYPDGQWTGLFRHVLKVFLLDAENRVRNIYSVGLMHPALVLADVRTLLLERAGR
jgi:cytochrome oxidase Cu insertion factor (SCO1/SenC/PrrC family)